MVVKFYFTYVGSVIYFLQFLSVVVPLNFSFVFDLGNFLLLRILLSFIIKRLLFALVPICRPTHYVPDQLFSRMIYLHLFVPIF